MAIASLDPDDSAFARIHLLDASDLQSRFDRAYAARRDAGHTIQLGRGVWIALYENEVLDPPTLVCAGAGRATEPIARIPLAKCDEQMVAGDVSPAGPPSPPATALAGAGDTNEGPLTIREAKSRLARALGVDPSSIKITVKA